MSGNCLTHSVPFFKKTNRERRVGGSKEALNLLHQSHPPPHLVPAILLLSLSFNKYFTSTTCQTLRVQRGVSAGPVLRKFMGGNGERESQANQQSPCRVSSAVMGKLGH